MKITKSQLRKIIKEEAANFTNEATQGEMEFAELEAAREAYLENRGDDEIRHQFGMQVEKLVEPIMSELGFYLQAEAFYSRGEIVFESFSPRIDVTIEPAGAMGRYDVGVYPMDESLTFSPIEMSVDTMKGALQFISDTLGETGMVGEPEAQAELPLGRRGVSRLPKWRRTAKEHKMRITKSQLQKIIKEEAAKALNESDVMAKVWEMSDAILEVMEPQKAFENLVQALGRDLAEDHLGFIIQQYEIPFGDDEVEDYDPNDF